MRGNGNYPLIFPKSYPGATIYLGTKFNDNFGAELGFDWSALQKRDWNIPLGQSLFNSTTTKAFSGTTKIRRQGGHLDILAFLPITDCFEVFGTIGYGWVKAKIEQSNLSITNDTTAPFNASAIASLKSKGKSVFRAGFGVISMFTDRVGLRAKLGLETTSSLRVNGNNAFTNNGYSLRGFKDSYSLAVGAFFKF
jgi:opacity protein-like surface antigen